MTQHRAGNNIAGKTHANVAAQSDRHGTKRGGEQQQDGDLVRYSSVMRPLRYSINVTLDGCCDHREGIADEELHRHAAWNLDQADALLFGRVTYEMMEAAWRPQAPTGAWPDWMEPLRY
jgi:hypothetical protein